MRLRHMHAAIAIATALAAAEDWAAEHNTWHLTNLMPKGVVFSFF